MDWCLVKHMDNFNFTLPLIITALALLLLVVGD